MSWLDQAIEWASPTWAAQRFAARKAIETAERLGNFESATPSRLDPTIMGRGAAADYELELGFDRRRQVDRARQLERDNVLADALLSRSTESIVGTGFTVQPRSESPAWNDKLLTLWNDWAANEADVRGLLTFEKMLAHLFRSYMRDGDAAFLMLSSGALRFIESDEISAPEGGYYRPDMVDGVELDEAGRPKTFHVFNKPYKGPLWSDRRLAPQRVPIPAQHVVFLARRQRAGQTRGLTAFNGVFWILEQLGASIEAVTVAARMAACFGLIIKRKGPYIGLNKTQDGSGNTRQKMRFEPGQVLRVEPDEDVQQVTPSQPGQNLESHHRFLVRLAGRPFGLPLEPLLGDYSQTNYSNARAELLDCWHTWRVHQHDVSVAASRVYKWKVLNWIKQGKLPARDDALAHSWQKPGWQWLDPVAEVQAALASVDLGVDTITNIARQRGHEIDDLVKVRAHERKLFADAGLYEVRSNFTRDPAPPPVAAGPSGSAKGAAAKPQPKKAAPKAE